MSGFGQIGRNDDIVNSSYVQTSINVTTTQIEAKVGASNLSGRQILRIYNNSNNTIYLGPTGVTTSTGEPLNKGEWIIFPVGDQISIFLIAASGSNPVIVQEFS